MALSWDVLAHAQLQQLRLQAWRPVHGVAGVWQPAGLAREEIGMQLMMLPNLQQGGRCSWF